MEDLIRMKMQNITGKGRGLAFATVAIVLFVISMVSAVTIKSVITNPSEVAPGETAKVSIEIENTLTVDIENVNVAIDLNNELPIAPYEGSSEETVDEIKDGDKEKFTFDIIVLPQASSGVYKIPVSINYEANGNKTTKNSTISIVVNSPPQTKLSVEGYLIKGREQKIELRIVNDGLSDLKFVSIQATQPFSGAVINSPLYEYLGNIDSDDFETVEYSIYTKDNAAASISIPVQISYKDATNKDFVQEETFNIKVYSQEEAQALGLIPGKNYILYLLAFIPAIYLIYRVRKRMKRKKALGA
jgi:hypothetical protein